MKLDDLSQWPPRRRMRRSRSGPSIRSVLQETHLSASDLIAPLFVKESATTPEPIASMPGVFRLGIRSVVDECRTLHTLGVRGVALFPCTDPSLKNPKGSGALDPQGLIPRTLAEIKSSVPGLLVFCDVALDPYTDHGHDGVLDASGTVDNDATVEILCHMSLCLAQAGANFVAPSDMMDGRVGAIRDTLDHSGHHSTGILAYAAKFASAYYGPFRDAVGSARPSSEGYLDKRGYQLNPANPREALLDALLDEEEGADILMVKPAGPYLDILTRLREHTLLPLAAYQVSGEYSMIHAAAERGWTDLPRTRLESLLAIKRAGADIILSYFTKTVAEELSRPSFSID